MVKIKIKSKLLKKLGITYNLENIFKRYNGEEKYACLIEKTQEYIYTDKVKRMYKKDAKEYKNEIRNIIHALELERSNIQNSNVVSQLATSFLCSVVVFCLDDLAEIAMEVLMWKFPANLSFVIVFLTMTVIIFRVLRFIDNSKKIILSDSERKEFLDFCIEEYKKE